MHLLGRGPNFSFHHWPSPAKSLSDDPLCFLPSSSVAIEHLSQLVSLLHAFNMSKPSQVSFPHQQTGCFQSTILRSLHFFSFLPMHKHTLIQANSPQVYVMLFLLSLSCITQLLTHTSGLNSNENHYFPRLFVCLVFNGTFSTNRLYRTITVG